jgi:hypothetical protein
MSRSVHSQGGYGGTTLEGEARRRHRVDHVLIAKRLWQEVDRTGLHSPHRHRDVAMSGRRHDRAWEVVSHMTKAMI